MFLKLIKSENGTDILIDYGCMTIIRKNIIVEKNYPAMSGAQKNVAKYTVFTCQMTNKFKIPTV